MDCSVKKYLDLLKIGNVIVENIKELDIEGLFVIDVVLKLLEKQLEEREQGILL